MSLKKLSVGAKSNKRARKPTLSIDAGSTLLKAAALHFSGISL